MRVVTQQTTDAWKASVKAGGTRPVVRATIERGTVTEHPYNTDDAAGGELEAGEMGVRTRKGVFRSINFNNTEVREIRNVRSISWGRSVDQDIAECTLTLLNADIAPIGGGGTISIGDDFEFPGLFTFSRGEQLEAQTRWGHTPDSGWVRQIVPDRLIRTYEGYGSDDTLPPGEDPHLYASGVWLIDSVDYNANGDISIKMRDLGRLLTDHIVFPPVVPRDDYPLEWSKIRTEMVEARDAVGGSWTQPPGTAHSSNNLYVGEGIDDNPDYVDAQGGVLGHYANHAWLAGRTENEAGELSGIGNEFYWLSTGQTGYYDKVWWQIDLDDPVNLAALKVSTRSGPYRMYVSLDLGNGWIGKKKIPYDISTEGVDLGAGIKFVTSFKSEHGFPLDFVLPRRYQGVTKVRLTFTRLRKLAPSQAYPWRAGLRNLELYTAPAIDDLSFADGEVATPIGNYRDFSQIVRWVGAWAGFYWPPSAEITYETGRTPVDMNYDSDFVSALPKGRTWGSFEWQGSAGEVDITSDQFDKQPLLDVISHVREITGCNFWIDEAGSIVWRQPNLFASGNYITPSHLDPDRSRPRTADYITIDEEETLLGYSTTLSSENVRERVFVGDSNGKYGAVVKGYKPHGGTGLMRIAGWTDGNFKRGDALIAADLIVARQMFDYRRAQVTIPGNPAIQIDDQIRIFERITAETYFHYVIGVSSELDMDEGTWTYSLETHWLGPDLAQAWVLDATELEDATQAFLNASGGID